MSSDEVCSSSVVGSVVDERGVKVFCYIVGSATKENYCEAVEAGKLL